MGDGLCIRLNRSGCGPLACESSTQAAHLPESSTGYRRQRQKVLGKFFGQSFCNAPLAGSQIAHPGRGLRRTQTPAFHRRLPTTQGSSSSAGPMPVGAMCSLVRRRQRTIAEMGLMPQHREQTLDSSYMRASSRLPMIARSAKAARP